MTYAKDIRIFWGILALYTLFGMHFFMHNQGGSGLYLPFNMVGWVFVSGLISIGVWHLTFTKKLIFSRIQIWYLIGFLILLIPFLNPQATWNIQAEPRFLAIFAGLLMFFSLSQFQFSEQQRHSLLYLLLGAVAIEVLYGIVQFFVLKDGNWFGYNVKVNRPYGIFQKDSVFSSFLAVGLAITFYLQRWENNVLISHWRQIFLSLILVVSPFLLIQIQSRAGMYGAILTTACMLPVLWDYNRRIFWWSLTLLVIGLSVGLVFYNSARAEDSYALTSTFRKLYWSHLLSMVPQAPWLGHGYGSFEYTFLHDFYSPEHIKPGMRLMEENLDHPHNELLFWLHEGGVVAVIGLFVFSAGYIRSLLKSHGWAKRISLLALVLPLLFHSMVEYPFYHSVAHFFFFIIFLWLADAESNQQKEIECNYWFLARVVAILIPIVVVPFMLTGLQTAYIITKYDRMKNKDPMLLEKIVNPLPWFSLYQFDIHSAQLMFGSAFNDKNSLTAFVDWARDFVHSTPRAIVYFQMVKALELLDSHDEAEKWLSEGKRLFPRNQNLQSLSLNAVSSSK